ncbi:MAG: hypothetical protein WBA76_11555 [Phormidesmis sp.]
MDFRALGGIAFIGKPKQPTITIYQLREDEYEKKQYRLLDSISSLVFPSLTLTLNDLMP